MDHAINADLALPLAAHLAHAKGEAWFDPIPLGATLPTNLRDASDEYRLKYIHEYTHFIQAASTFFGANRMHTFFWNMSALRRLLVACDGKLDCLDLAAFETQANKKYDSLDQITRATILETRYEQLLAETDLEGFQQVDNGIVKFPALLRRIDSTKVSVAPIGVRALQESMAFAVERWIEPELTHGLYDAVINMENWGHFDYASVSEALHSISGWSEETVIWVTVVICDVALDHYLPLHAFTLAFAYLRNHYALTEPNIGKLEMLHAELREACYISLAEKDRAALIGELTRVTGLPDKDSSPSDWIFAKYFQLYLDAFAIRAKKQHAFAERLLFLETGCPDELREFESIPYYMTSQGLVSSREDTDLVTAGLAVICMQHFSRYLTDSARSQPAVCKRCPLFDMPGVCDYTKGSHCYEHPWFAPEEDGQSCVYRFATDALGVQLELPTSDANR